MQWVREAQRLRAQLNWSLPEIGVPHLGAQDAARGVSGGHAGAGVIIGVADYGIDFAHPNFRHGLGGQGGTRLLALWDQNGEVPGRDGLPRGRVIGPGAINAALQAPGCPMPRSAIIRMTILRRPQPGGRPRHRRGGRRARHPCARHRRRQRRRHRAAGVAPEAGLVFVQLPRFDWQDPGDLAQGAWVYEAAAFIFAQAAEARMPAVVNLSLTTNTGTHDGTNPVEVALTALLRAPGRAVVVCAGNERTSRTHSTGIASPGRPQTLVWRQPARDAIPNQLLVCHADASALRLTLTPPGAEAETVELLASAEADGEYELRWGTPPLARW
ncbi:S8 family serine peptidase [Siccirubricoccus deserti]